MPKLRFITTTTHQQQGQPKLLNFKFTNPENVSQVWVWTEDNQLTDRRGAVPRRSVPLDKWEKSGNNSGLGVLWTDIEFTSKDMMKLFVDFVCRGHNQISFVDGKGVEQNARGPRGVRPIRMVDVGVEDGNKAAQQKDITKARFIVGNLDHEKLSQLAWQIGVIPTGKSYDFLYCEMVKEAEKLAARIIQHETVSPEMAMDTYIFKAKKLTGENKLPILSCDNAGQYQFGNGGIRQFATLEILKLEMAKDADLYNFLKSEVAKAESTTVEAVEEYKKTNYAPRPEKLVADELAQAVTDKLGYNEFRERVVEILTPKATKDIVKSQDILALVYQMDTHYPNGRDKTNEAIEKALKEVHGDKDWTGTLGKWGKLLSIDFGF